MNALTLDKSDSLSPLWLKAAVAGGLWASVEIIVGSFLHNIRVPFAGGVLASFGVMLMVAFYRLWPERGLIWRAGIVCALMKSISPSANILGPMIGITIEAFLLDIFIRLLGKSMPAMMVAGGISVFSAFAYKVFNILVIYGFSLVRVYLNLFDFAARQMGYASANPWFLVIVPGSIYFSLGVFSAFAGFAIGKRSSGFKNHDDLPDLESSREFFRHSAQQPYSLLLLFLNLLAIPAGIILINKAPFIVSLSASMLFLVFCTWKYRSLLRRLSKPVLWIQLMLVVLLSAFFWKNSEGNNQIFHSQGLLVGFEMVVRAMIVISAFIGISTELRNPLVSVFLKKKGLKQVYNAVSLAFQALPVMLEDTVKPRELFLRPFATVARMLANARNWEKAFENRERDS